MKKRLTKKQVQDFAKIYIGCQMMLIDGGCVGDIADVVSDEDVSRIVKEINSQGEKILGKRKYCTDPVQIIYNLTAKIKLSWMTNTKHRKAPNLKN